MPNICVICFGLVYQDWHSNRVDCP